MTMHRPFTTSIPALLACVASAVFSAGSTRAGVPGEGLSRFNPKLIANAGGDVVPEPVGRPAEDAEHLAVARDRVAISA